MRKAVSSDGEYLSDGDNCLPRQIDLVGELLLRHLPRCAEIADVVPDAAH